jgi:mannose/fructose/N-acetylgalactosamine-specific phosphotransferase system component IIC
MCLLTIPILPMQPFAVPVLGISIIGILIALFGSRLSPKEELCVS